MKTPVRSRGHLLTEGRNPASMDLDRLSVEEALRRMQEEDQKMHAAIAAARPEIARTVELAVRAIRSGGRMFYVGAGTSGRLGVLDAVELPPTFQSDPAWFQGVLAGGKVALTSAVEGAEDDAEAARVDLAMRRVGEKDVVLGIAAGGTTAYVHGALAFARERGAKTIFFSCVPREQAPDDADVSIRVLTGPEFLTGSTRLKAGTATKLVLNAISTLAMAQLGKVYQNLMVDLRTRGNKKLIDRGTRIVSMLTGAAAEESAALLDASGGQVKVAVVMKAKALDRAAAEARLRACGGGLRAALEGG